MSKRQVLMLIGVWVMVILYLGFPKDWDKILLLVTGVIIILIAYKSKPPAGTSAEDKKDRPYIDNQPGRSGTGS